MATKEECAQLSLFVYRVQADANQENRPLLPSGWELAEPLHPDDGFGFSYGVFRRTGSNEVVVSFAGTNSNIDWVSNATNGIGLSSAQTTEAALAYLAAKTQYGANITLTGHSLGGGLASILAVWFDRPAVVFDEAPFELTARNPLVIGATYAALITADWNVGAFEGYTGLLDFYVREAQVTNYYASEEALQLGRMLWPTVLGTDNRIEFGVQNMLTRRIDLHSQALLTAGILSNDFANATIAAQRTLPILMDKSFYAYDAATSDQQNVLINFIRSEQGTGKKLTHFTADLQKLGANLAGLTVKAQDAVIAQGIEWYYWQGNDYAGQEFLSKTGDLLQYSTAQGAGLPNALNKASFYARGWLDAAYTASTGDTRFAPMGTAFDQWNVAASASTGVTATARNAAKSQIFIGQAGGDNFTGGDVGDVVMSGGGADTLNGGAGSDHLYGGAGDDRYDFTGSFGSDIVRDGDGSGTLWVDGIKLTGGKKLADNLWESTDGNYRFSVLAGNLTIGGGGEADASTMQGSITVVGWQAGQLGITLDNTSADSPPSAATYTGDQHAPLYGSGSYNWGATSWQVDGTLAGGLAQADFNDVIYGTAADDKVRGLGGNDALDGGEGNDVIEGGDGDDLIGGGAGSDNIQGGAGNDFILSATGLTVPQRVRPSDTFTVPGDATVRSTGPTWAIYNQGPNLFIEGGGSIPADQDGDVVDGGAGDDFIVGGLGADHLKGGDGNDSVFGHGGGDVIEGNAGDDILFGDAYTTPADLYRTVQGDKHGADFIDGGDGNDSIVGGGDADALYGGAGDDVIVGDSAGENPNEVGWLSGQYHGDDYIDGEDGDDMLAGDGGDDTIYGGSGDDQLQGDRLQSQLPGQFHGNDYLDGEDGNDLLLGGGKDDVLFGGDGNDNLQGDGDDVAGEVHGNDYLDGEDGDDVLIGGGKDDGLFGGAGNDQLQGDAIGLAGEFHGNDYLDGEDGDDVLIGGGKDDQLFGGAGNDTLLGDDLLDRLGAQFAGNDYLDGGDGNDYLSGGGGNDILIGGAGANYLDGGDGDDSYEVSLGDTIHDSGGRNSISINGGAPTVVTVQGEDLVLGFGASGSSQAAAQGMHLMSANVDASSNSLVIEKAFQGGDFALGGVALDAAFFSGYDVTLTTTADHQHLSGWGGNDTLTAEHEDATLDGGGGNDVITGNWSNDVLIGGSGSNTLWGGSGDDILVSSGQVDVLDGGFGNDTYRIAAEAGEVTIAVGKDYDVGQDTVVLTGSSSTTTLTASIVDEDAVITSSRKVTAADGTVTQVAGTTVRLTGLYHAASVSPISDSVSAISFEDGSSVSLAQLLVTNTAGGATDDVLKGTAFFDQIDGGGGDDEIHAGAGNDTLIGGTGNDRLYGDSGKDTLEGGEGNDILRGGYGSDILRGGAGDDVYLFGAELEPEVLTDREDGQQVDVIEDSEGNNVISLGSGVNLAGVMFVKTSDSLSTLYFHGQKIEIHGPTSGFTVQANGQSRTLESFIQTIEPVIVDPGLTEAQQTVLAERENAATAAISQAVLAGRFAEFTDSTSSLWKHVESNDASITGVALPVDAEVETEYYGVLGYRDSAGNAVSSNVVYGDYSATLLPEKGGLVVLQRILAQQGRHIDLSSISPSNIYLGPDEPGPGGWHHGQVLGWSWEGRDRDLRETYGTYKVTRTITHQDTVAANVVLGDADNQLTVGASVVHAGGGNDVITNYGRWLHDSYWYNQTERAALLSGVTASFVDGGDGNDQIHGSELNDVIVGGRGRDLLDGSTGSDRYLVLDYGQSSDDEDLITDREVTSAGVEIFPPVYESGVDVDVVEFGPGIALADLYFLRESDPGNPDGPGRLVALRHGRRLVSIELAHPDDPPGAGVEFLQFQDGQTISMDYALAISHGSVPLTAEVAAVAQGAEHSELHYALGGVVWGGTGNVTLSVSLTDGSALPAWLAYDPATRSLTGTPEMDAVGTLMVKVTASDESGATVVASLLIAIADVNDAPVAYAIAPGLTAPPDQQFLEQLGADLFTDVDVGDALTWRLQMADGSPLPAWLGFDPVTRTLAGTPTYDDAGVIDLQVSVTDRAGASAGQTFQLNVGETEGAFIVGSAVADNLIGTAGNDTIDGLGRADVMSGRAGHDLYVVDNRKDVINELFNQGYDRVQAQVTYTLPDNVEAIVLMGTRNIAATGNALDNELTGNSGNNRLDGGAGSDHMSGGAGNDVYVVDNAGDWLDELDGEGTDTVIASISYTLAPNVERLTLTGPGLTGTGNNLNNLMIAGDGGSTLAGMGGNDTLRGGAGSDTLLGGEGNDRLDGGVGSDRMEGGAGNDVYLVDDQADAVVELAAGGTDTVQASISFTLSSDVENLTLSGSGDLQGTGNDLGNTIVGNSGRNELNGLGGNDRLRGGAGDDRLLGGDGNDRLDGGTGADQLTGGAGNDIYIVDHAGDRVEEFADEGRDAVQSSVSYVLGANVEDLTLTGAGILSGSGNELNNVLAANGTGSVLNGLGGNDTLKGGLAHDVLSGGEGNDRLDGGAGGDSLVGGIGNDVYVVDDAADEVVELANEGTDTVQSSIDYALGANVENLTLTGSESLNGTGNELANVMTGNGSASRLAGLAGNDTLKGGAAADVLIGGTGNDRLEGGLGGDTYLFGRGDGQDTIVENDASADVVDMLHFEAGIDAGQLWWRKAGNNLEVSVIGSGDKVTLSNWYLGSERYVERFELANGLQLLDTQVQALVQAMASFSPPAAGQTSLPAAYQDTLNGVLAANWH